MDLDDLAESESDSETENEANENSKLKRKLDSPEGLETKRRKTSVVDLIVMPVLDLIIGNVQFYFV